MSNKVFTLPNGTKVIRKVHKQGDSFTNNLSVCGNCDFEMGKKCPLDKWRSKLCFRKGDSLANWTYYLKIVK